MVVVVDDPNDRIIALYNGWYRLILKEKEGQLYIFDYLRGDDEVPEVNKLQEALEARLNAPRTEDTSGEVEVSAMASHLTFSTMVFDVFMTETTTLLRNQLREVGASLVALDKESGSSIYPMQIEKRKLEKLRTTIVSLKEILDSVMSDGEASKDVKMNVLVNHLYSLEECDGLVHEFLETIERAKDAIEDNKENPDGVSGFLGLSFSADSIWLSCIGILLAIVLHDPQEAPKQRHCRLLLNLMYWFCYVFTLQDLRGICFGDSGRNNCCHRCCACLPTGWFSCCR